MTIEKHIAKAVEMAKGETPEDMEKAITYAKKCGSAVEQGLSKFLATVFD